MSFEKLPDDRGDWKEHVHVLGKGHHEKSIVVAFEGPAAEFIHYLSGQIAGGGESPRGLFDIIWTFLDEQDPDFDPDVYCMEVADMIESQARSFSRSAIFRVYRADETRKDEHAIPEEEVGECDD